MVARTRRDFWIDGYNGVAHHIAQKVDLAIVAAADPPVLRANACGRGWHNLRLLCTGDPPNFYARTRGNVVVGEESEVGETAITTKGRLVRPGRHVEVALA